MHLYIATKGIKHDVDRFITELQGKYMPWKWRAKKEDKLENTTVQLAIRPIQLWEIGYPKELNDIVCTTILGKENVGAVGNDGKKPVVHKWANRFISIFRKFLHLDPIPPYRNDKGYPVYNANVAVIGLGTKQDHILDTGVEGL